MSEDVTVANLRAKVDQYLSLKEAIKEHEHEIEVLNKRIAPITSELIQIMESMDMKNFAGSKGKVEFRTVDYVSNPQTEEDRTAFYDYLKQNGEFEDMVSVHHQKLNSYFNAKLEQAISEGSEFHIPGLEVKQRKEIRKGRGKV
jgi:hypothetical protein